MLNALVNKHLGEEAWLLGKGPSLDLLDISKTHGVLAVCNEAIYAYPEADYVFSFYADRKDIDAGDAMLFTGEEYHGCFCHDIEDYEPRSSLFIKHSTAEMALSVLLIMGVAKVHLCGFDPGEKYSKQFEFKGHEPNAASTAVQKMIKNNMADMAEKACVPIYDWSRN
jgi:hypothetical protein